MQTFINKIFKEENLNSLLITAVFLFFTGWWAVLYIGFSSHYDAANMVWSSYYQVVTILGAYIGFFVYRYLDKTAPTSRRVIIFFAISLLGQTFGQSAYTANALFFSKTILYQSWSDIFFILSVFAYLTAIILLYIDIIKKVNLRKSITAAFFWMVLLGVAQTWILYKIGYSLSWSFSSALELLYLVPETIFASLALGACFGTRFFANTKFRAGYVLLLVGMVCQVITDFYYLCAFHLNMWTIAGFGDYLYLFSYFILSLGIVQFTASFIAINIFVVLFNSFLFIQFLLSGSLDRVFVNGILLFICLLISYFLLRRNKNEVAQKEKLARFEAMEDSNRQLLELDHQKTEFLTIAAHQLRTPVSIINNYIGMLQDGDYGPVAEEAKKVLSNMDQSNQWLVRLADEFLNIANLEQGQTKFHFSKTNIVQLISKVVEEMNFKAQAVGLKITFNQPPEPLFAEVDEEKFKHVLLNFMDNAVKYGKIDGDEKVGEIEITARDGATSPCPPLKRGGLAVSPLFKEGTVGRSKQSPVGIAIRIHDTGIGFDHEDEQRLFQKFSRGKNAKGMHVNLSTGLGLDIAKKFVEGHGGYVWGKSEGPLKGSEFGIWIPASH